MHSLVAKKSTHIEYRTSKDSFIIKSVLFVSHPGASKNMFENRSKTVSKSYITMHCSANTPVLSRMLHRHIFISLHDSAAAHFAASSIRAWAGEAAVFGARHLDYLGD
jgi:hypothetical protein